MTQLDFIEWLQKFLKNKNELYNYEIIQIQHHLNSINNENCNISSR